MHSPHTTQKTAYSGDPNIRTSPVPAGHFVRVDSGVEHGSSVLPHYDPMSTPVVYAPNQTIG